jgi:hypothetical protein
VNSETLFSMALGILISGGQAFFIAKNAIPSRKHNSLMQRTSLILEFTLYFT